MENFVNKLMDWFWFYTTQGTLYSKKLTLLSYKESIHRLKELSVEIVS